MVLDLLALAVCCEPVDRDLIIEHIARSRGNDAELVSRVRVSRHLQSELAKVGLHLERRTIVNCSAFRQQDHSVK